MGAFVHAAVSFLRGRPATRWEDALEAFAKRSAFKWEVVARDADLWRSWEGAFGKSGG